MMRINLSVDRASIQNFGKRLSVDLEDVDVDELVSEVGTAHVLDAVGKETAMKHFDLKENDE